MEKTITTALLVIGSIVATVALINAVIPAAGKSSGALLTANSDAADRIKTDIEIIFASGDTGDKQIVFWTKSVGSKTIIRISESDIFLNTPTGPSRIAYDAACSASVPPCWSYAFEGGETDWTRAVTIKATLELSSLSTGIHKITMTVYNAVSAEKEFSI